MQFSDIQCGTFGAMPRFSRHEVPVGSLPSTDMADTGISSPSRCIVGLMTFFANSLASSEISFFGTKDFVMASGIFTFSMAATVLSTAFQFFWTISIPFSLKDFSMAPLMYFIAASSFIIPDILKKATCMTVLILPPSPACVAIFRAFIL